MTTRKEYQDKKARLEAFPSNNTMLFRTALETIKKDICVKVMDDYKSPSELVAKGVCSLVDAEKIGAARFDLVTLEFLLMVLCNTDRKSYSSGYKELIIRKYDISLDEVLPFLNKPIFSEDFKFQILTIDRLVEFIDIKMGFKENAGFFLGNEGSPETLEDHDKLVDQDVSAINYADLSVPESSDQAIMKDLCNEVIKAKRESGLSTEEFCRKHGTSEDLLKRINSRSISSLTRADLLKILGRTPEY